MGKEIDFEKEIGEISLKNEVESEIKDVENLEDEPSKETSSDEDKTQELFAEFSQFAESHSSLNEDYRNRMLISTGIDLVDAILGGGFAAGTLGIIVGQPGSGKSMLAMQTIAKGQKQHDKMLSAFLDSEEATTIVRLANLGVRNPKMRPLTNITIEKVFKYIEGVCLFKEQKQLIDTPSLVVWDSIANTLSEKEMEIEDPNQTIGYKARLLTLLLPKYVAKMNKHNICLLAVNQLRDVMSIGGPFGPPKDLKFMTQSKDMPGGNALKFNAFHLVEMKVKSAITKDSQTTGKYGFEGIISKVKCVKNKLFPPNIEVEILGSFTNGFSNFWTNFNFLDTHKRLKTGAWNYLVDMPDKKFRTKDAPNIYKTDENFREAFQKAVKETIQIEIIDKYNTVEEE